MMTSRHIAAPEVRHQQRVKERERDSVSNKTRKRGKEAPSYRERERARNIFHDGVQVCNM